MADRVATGEIYIGLRDSEAIAGLRKIGQEFDRAMDKIDRRKVDAKIDGDITPLKESLARAEKALREYDKRRATASKEELKRLDAEREAQNDYVNALKRRINAQGASDKRMAKSNAILDDTRDRLAAIQKLGEKMDRTAAAAARRREAEMRAEARLRETARKDRLREIQGWEALNQKLERQERLVPSLEAKYARLQTRLEKLAEARHKAMGDERATYLIDVEARNVLGEVEAVREKIRLYAGRDPIDIPLRVDSRGTRWGRELRYEFEKAGGSIAATAAAVGERVGRRFGTTIATGTRDTLDRGLSRTLRDVGSRSVGVVGRNLLGGLQRLGRAAEGLSNATVRLGPFTTSIRGAFIGLSLLGPILIDVVGAIGALAGSVGAATAGLGALGTAVAGGAIPTFLGWGIVIKQVASEFKNVMAAQKAYDDAIRKGNTDLAKDKMKELQATMGNVSKETVRQIGAARDLNSEWKKQTADARASVFTTIGQAIKTASGLMPMFAKNTNESMATASAGVNKWLESLRSAEGASTLDEMMDNFNRALGPALDGLGSFMGYLGRVGAIASRSLPGLATTFRDWARDLNSVSTTDLEGKVEGVIDSAKNLGNFFLEAGRLMKSFFGAGVEAGDDLIETMTNAMKTWRRGFETPQGRNDLANFFEESTEGAKTLWHALAPVVSSFVKWAAQIAPFARAFFDGAAAIGNFVSSLLDVTALRAPIAAFVTTIGGLWAINKISTATQAVGAFARALTGLGRTQAGVTAVARGASIPAYLVPAGAVSNVNKATTSVSRLGRVGSVASRSLSGIGAALTGWSNPWIGAAILGGGLAFALSKIIDTTDDWEGSMAAADEALRKGNAAAERLADSYGPLAQQASAVKDANRTVADAQREVNGLLENGKRGTDEYRTAVQRLNDEIFNRDQAQEQQRKDLRAQNRDLVTDLRSFTEAMKEAKEQRDELADERVSLMDNDQIAEDVDAFEDSITSVEDAFRTVKAQAKSSGQTLEKYLDGLDINDEYKEKLLAYGDALAGIQEGEKGLRGQALAVANIAREFKGMYPIAERAADAVDYLNRKLGQKKTQQISLKFRGAEDAARVAQSAARSLRAGVPKSVTTRLVANSSNADAAVRSLQRAQLTPKRLDIIQKGGDDAVRVLEQIEGRKLTKHELKIAQQGGDDVLDKLRKINATDLPTKKQELETEGEQALTSTLKAIIGVVFPTKKQRVEGEAENVFNLFDVLRGTVLPAIIQWVEYRERGPKPKAAGQRPTSGKTSAMVGEGSDFKGAKEYVVDGKTGSVSVVSAPTIMPLGPSDAVIPTEPRHRDRGRSIFKEMARDLGVAAYAKGKKWQPPKPDTNPAFGTMDELGFNPTAQINAGIKFKPGKAKNKKDAFKMNNAITSYVKGLMTQQEYWEREVSIRESEVMEPEEMVVRDPARDQTVTDPVTGETRTVEAYRANPLIESAYMPALQRVLNAMDQLMAIVRELIRVLPMAVASNQTELHYRNKNLGDLEKKLKHESNKKHPSPKTVTQLSNKIQSEKNEMSALREDVDTFKGAYTDAGFDLREFAIQRRDIQIRKDEALPEAQADAAEQTQQNIDSATGGGTGGGGGGAGTGGISYGQQAALADTEKSDVLRQFGGNTASVGQTPGGVGAAVAGLGQAMQRNAASIITAASGVTGGGLGAQGGTASPQAFGDMRAASAALSGSSGAAAAVNSGPAVAGSGGAGTTIINEKNVTMPVTFAEVPPDPHTFARGVEFEIGAAV